MAGDGQESREASIRALMPLVRRLAHRLKRLVRAFDLDDLIGDGCVGLLRAVDSYDPQRGPSLAGYARRLILGAMLNGIRRMDPVSERSRRLARDGETHRYALAAELGSLPSTAHMETLHPGFTRAVAAAHWGQPLSLDATLPDGESLSGDWSRDPATILANASARAALAERIRALPPRQRSVVVQHYFAGRSLRAIGRALAISPQRTSQLHLAAIARLRKTVDRAVTTA